MILNFLNRFGNTLYVQIWENRLKVIDCESGKSFDESPLVAIESQSNGQKRVIAVGNNAAEKSGEHTETVNPFSHPRVLFSDFEVGVKLLQAVFFQLLGRSTFKPKPKIIIHPMEKAEGGMTMIELRAFRELALAAGVSDVKIYFGPELHSSQLYFSRIEDISNRDKSKKGSGASKRLVFVLVFYAGILAVLIKYGS